MTMSEKRGRLAFIGLGLHDENSISLAGLRELERAETVFAESYTSFLSDGSLDRLSAKIGKGIEVLSREDVEKGKRILDECATRNVAFLVAGDPMIATTHVDLRIRAAMQDSDTAIVHGASAITAVPGILGLQSYKFGRTTTLATPQEGYFPISPYEIVNENLSRGLHTLVLLDIDADAERYMTASEGLNLLMRMEKLAGLGALSENTLACVVARAGAPDCVARAGRIADLAEMDFGPPMHSIVIPGRLHFMETEALKMFAQLSTELAPE